MQVATGVYHFETFPFNWYVIEEGGRLTVLDAGFPGHYDVLLAGLRSIGRDLKDIEAVLLTHIHADHVGFAERLRRAGIPVFVHEDDLAASRSVPRLPPVGFFINVWRPFVPRWIIANGVFAGAFNTEDIGKAHVFRDGQRLELPGRPIALHMPGHTAGECMFFLEERNTLISGDALVTLNMLTGQATPPRVPYKYLNDDDQKARDSVRHLDGLGMVTMLPGHGGPWTGDLASALSGEGD
jgi:glyoxylase-like metal-dependent hydrolase (beta-lactamase superfamily II)